MRARHAEHGAADVTDMHGFGYVGEPKSITTRTAILPQQMPSRSPQHLQLFFFSDRAGAV